MDFAHRRRNTQFSRTWIVSAGPGLDFLTMSTPAKPVMTAEVLRKMKDRREQEKLRNSPDVKIYLILYNAVQALGWYDRRFFLFCSDARKGVTCFFSWFFIM